MQHKLKIGEVAKKIQLSIDSIRYYEKEKLISPERSEKGYRYFSEEDINQLKYITVMRKANFSIGEIRAFMKLRNQSPSKNCSLDTQLMVHKKIISLEQTVDFYTKILQVVKGIPITTYQEKLTEKEPIGNQNNESLDAYINILFDELMKG